MCFFFRGSVRYVDGDTLRPHEGPLCLPHSFTWVGLLHGALAVRTLQVLLWTTWARVAGPWVPSKEEEGRKRGRKRGGDGCINDMSAVWVGVVVGVWTYLRRSARRARSLSLSVIGGESC